MNTPTCCWPVLLADSASQPNGESEIHPLAMVAAAFFLFFATGFVAGYVAGRKKRKTPRLLAFEIYKRSKVEPFGSSKQVIYPAHGPTLYKLDVNTQEDEFVDKEWPKEARQQEIKAPPIATKSAPLIPGIWAGYTIKDAFKLLTTEGGSGNAVSTLVAAVVGTVSGFWIGFRYGVAGKLDDRDPMIQEFLETKEGPKEISRFAERDAKKSPEVRDDT